MTAEPIISVSGLRGVVGESLTPEVAMRYVQAFAAELPPGPVVIGRDGRASGSEFAAIAANAMAANGRHVFDAGVAATPTMGVLVRDLRASGGIQVSASHNPSQYNGLKLFSSAGRVIPAVDGQRVLDRYRQLQLERLDAVAEPAGARGDGSSVQSIRDTISAHLELVEQICDVEAIRRRRFRVMLDANHGAGGLLGAELLSELGCEATVLGQQPDGHFAHPPEPTEPNLAPVLQEVVRMNADVGFCQDPDADRLAVLEERGQYIGEEKTLALCVDHLLRSGVRGPVATNCSTSRMSEELARRYDVPFFRSKVGEANVVDLMLEHDAVIGGEGNGGVIDPRVGLVRDSFVGIAMILDAMASTGLRVSELAAALPRYAIHKTTVAVAADMMPRALRSLEEAFGDAAADRLDGLRLDWPSGDWLLVRPSNTEPIVRAIAEARSLDEAKSLCDRASRILTR